MSSPNETTPPTTQTNPAPETLEAVRKEAYADGRLLVDEFRKIVEKAAEGGVTKEEKALVKQDLGKAMQDNPDAESRALLAAYAQLILTNKEIVSKFLYVIGALLGFGLLSWLIQLLQYYNLLLLK